MGFLEHKHNIVKKKMFREENLGTKGGKNKNVDNNYTYIK